MWLSYSRQEVRQDLRLYSARQALAVHAILTLPMLTRLLLKWLPLLVPELPRMPDYDKKDF